MKTAINPMQCKSCKYHGYMGSTDSAVCCDLLGKTGICRITSGPLTDERGDCRWYVVETGKTPWVTPKKEVKPRHKAPYTGAKRGRKSYRVAQVDLFGHVMAIYPGVQSAAKATGLNEMYVYQSCNWRRVKNKKPYSGNAGRKGYILRYATDEDVKEAVTAYEQRRKEI